MRLICRTIHLYRHAFASRRLLSSSYYVDRHIGLLLSSHDTGRITVETLRRQHGLIVTGGNSSNIFIASKVISFYACLHKPDEATRVFLSVQPKDDFLWNSIIKAQFSNGDYAKSLEFFLAMRRSDICPNHFTIPMVVSSCGELLLEDFGRSVHGLVLKIGNLSGNRATGPSFVFMYGKCNCVEEARFLFDEMLVRDVVAWTAIIIALVQNGKGKEGLKYLCQMHRDIECEDSKPNSRTMEGGFQACADLGALAVGQCLHALVVKTGLYCHQTVLSSAFSMYSKSGTPDEAFSCFCELREKDRFSWTAAIGLFSRLGYVKECLALFWEMQDDKIYPDGIIISCVISGFINSMLISEGRAFHGVILRHSYPFDHRVYNTLLSMYCKFECLSGAEKLFRSVNTGDEDAWNTMLKGYFMMGLHRKCIEYYGQMQTLGMECKPAGVVSVISSCSQLTATSWGRSIHCNVVKNDMINEKPVCNALIDMYGKFGSLTDAGRLFSEALGDASTWCTMISLYYQQGHYAESLRLFDLMSSRNLKPNSTTMVTLISACSNLASLDKGLRVHRYVEEERYNINLPLATALIDMYAKCGQVDKSRQLFDALNERDVICWNAMISGYGMHGDVETAIDIFGEMEKSNVEPNEVTFLALISACNHAGLVEQGKRVFRMMQQYGVKPKLKHYASMVDLLGRSGNLRDAVELVISMPFSPDGAVWGNILSSAMIHGELEIGVKMAKMAIELDPGNDGYYITLANMYGALGRWEEAEGAREMMKRKGVGKRGARSSI